MKDFPPVELAKEAGALLSLYDKGAISLMELRGMIGKHQDYELLKRDRDREEKIGIANNSNSQQKIK